MIQRFNLTGTCDQHEWAVVAELNWADSDRWQVGTHYGNLSFLAM
ncbi:MAG: hypothetical protein AAFR73_12530 [Pseudomonadota bacterium]